MKKFFLNLNYKIEADSITDAQEIVQQITTNQSFANGKAQITGMNLNQQEEYPAVGAIAAASPTPVDDIDAADEDGCEKVTD